MYEKKKSSKESISKEVEDFLLGTDDIQPSPVTATKEKFASNLPSTVSNASSVSNSSNDPLQLILARLEAMHGRLAVLETKSAESATSYGVYGVESSLW